MIAMFSLLLVVTLSMLITRIGAIALVLTGVPHEVARFQARSAYTGTGYTTSESDMILEHPVRRRIVMMLMFIGNLGVATVVAASILSFVNISNNKFGWGLFSALVGGLLLIWIVFTNKMFDQWLNKIIAHGLKRWTNLTVKDYIAILHLQKDYAVSELFIEPQDWLTGKTLIESALTKEGILVLGVQRKSGLYLGVPRGECVVEDGDTLMLYGKIEQLEELDRRHKGQRGENAHKKAIKEFVDIVEDEQQLDEERKEDEQT